MACAKHVFHTLPIQTQVYKGQRLRHIFMSANWSAQVPPKPKILGSTHAILGVWDYSRDLLNYLEPHHQMNHYRQQLLGIGQSLSYPRRKIHKIMAGTMLDFLL